MHNSHKEFPHQAVKHWQHLHPVVSAAGPSHPSKFLFIFPSRSVSEGLIPLFSVSEGLIPFFNTIVPGVPPRSPLPAVRWEPVVLLGIVGSAGTPRDSLLLPFVPEHGASPDNGRKPRPARLPGPERPGEGAQRGPHCSGPINSGNPGAEWKEVSESSGPGLRG